MSDYKQFVEDIRHLLTEARRQAVRSINAIQTAAYWETGRKIVQFEQKGEKRAGYGEKIVVRLSKDLTEKLGRGFGLSHVKLMRQFYGKYLLTKNIVFDD